MTSTTEEWHPYHDFQIPPSKRAHLRTVKLTPKVRHSKQLVERLANLDEGLASVNVVYEVVWMAGQPPSTQLQSPLIRLRKPKGSIRITGPATDGSIWRATEPPSTLHQEPPIDHVSIYNPSGYTLCREIVGRVLEVEGSLRS